MEEVTHTSRISPFNGPLEAGVRAGLLLYTSFPKSSDLQRLTALDYLLVHTGSLGGPTDLHPETPLGTPATQVRRQTVLAGLHLMMSKRLVEEMPEESGLVYRAGESAALFFNSLESSYMQQLAARAKWLNDTLRETSDLELDQLMKKLFNDWVVEFTGNDSFTEVKK
jgi:hypothetical protein